MDIVAFLAARLDEDQQIALDVSDGPRKPEVWEAKQSPHGRFPRDWVVDCPFGAVVVDGSFEAAAEHIARHDPARVLRDVAAKRHLVEWCAEATKHLDWTLISEWGSLRDDPNPRATHTAILALQTMAAPYADHPDYDPAWRVEA